MKKIQKSVRTLLAVLLIFTGIGFTSINAEDVNTESFTNTESNEVVETNDTNNNSEEAQDESDVSVPKEPTLEANDFSIGTTQLPDLTKQSALEKANAVTSDGSKITVDNTEFSKLKSATEGKYPLTFYAGQQQVAVIEVTVIDTTGIEPLISVNDNRVAVEIDDYIPSVGWNAGNIYKMKVNPKFLEGETNKKLEITLPAGMRFVNYPVLTKQNDLEYEATGVLAQLMTNVTSPSEGDEPSRRGTLTYEFADGAENIALEIWVSVDKRFITNDVVLTDSIVTKATTNNNTEIGNVHLDINAKGYKQLSVYADRSTHTTAKKDQEDIQLAGIYSVGGGRENLYVQSLEFTIYYPAGFQYVGSNNDVNKIEHNDALGYVKYRYEDRFIWQDDLMTYIILSGAGIAPGVYSTTQSPTIEAKNFRGDAIAFVAGSMPITIDVQETLPNKVEVQGTGSAFYEMSETYNTPGPLFLVKNDNATEKTDQVYEVTIDPGYQAHGVVIPYDTAKMNAIEVWYRTNLNSNLVKANQSGIRYNGVVHGSAGQAIVDKHSLGLATNEYVTYVKAEIGDLSRGFISFNESVWFSVPETLHVPGRLAPGQNHANVTVKTYAEQAGNIEPGTESTVVVPVYRSTTRGSTTVYREMGATAITAGKTERQFINLKPTLFRYGDYHTLINPTIYLRVPNGISYKNFTVTNSSTGANVPFTVTGPYTSSSSGETFVKVAVDGKFGTYTHDMTISNMQMAFDIEANIQAASGNYNWQDYAFIQDEVHGFAGVHLQPKEVLDSLDVDNDGDTSETILPILETGFIVQSLEALVIDTYILPAGETEKRPSYNGTESTAVAFTPGTSANYTVDVFNNCVKAVDTLKAYIPVPRENNDFGSNFQSTAFKWNMKLTGAPVIKVYDTNNNNADVSATRAANYIIEYTDGATNDSNYESATYSSTLNANTSMIRLTNIGDIPRGEKVVIEFPYEVDETSASVDATPEKLGAINDFAPYYYFKEVDGVSGYLSGTKVGALLSIGSVKGMVFYDNNQNGIYDAGDTLATSGTINLFEKDASGVYQPHAITPTTTVQADGTYEFTGLALKTYKLDFNAVLGANQKFTVMNLGNDDTVDSDVHHTGVEVGTVSEVQAALRSSKTMSVGIITNYAAPTISADDVYVAINDAKTDAQLAAINNLITTGSFTTVTLDQSAVNYTAVGDYTANYTVTDAYGATATTSITIHVVKLINASNFVVKLADVTSADFVALAGATATDISTPTSSTSITPTLTSAKPTTVGLHDVTFIASNGATITVQALVTNGDIHNNQVAIANNFQITLADVESADFVALANAKGYDISDLTDIKEIAVTLTSAKPTVAGLHTARFETPGGAFVEIQVLVTNEDPSIDPVDPTIEYAVTANNFQITLADVAGADFIALANAKAYKIQNNVFTEIPVTLTSEKPTVVGLHTARFESLYGSFAEIQVLVTNEDPVIDPVDPTINYAITANNFQIKLADVAEADFIALANATGYKIQNHTFTNSEPVTLVTAKPTTVGMHTARFETTGGAFAEVQVLVTNEDPIIDPTTDTKQAIYASNFQIKLTDVTEADFIALANAKGYDITDIHNMVEIPVQLVSEKPTTVGMHTARFETAGGAYAEVIVLVTNEDEVIDPVTDTKQVVVASDFSIDLADVPAADFIALANAKGYDITNINDMVEIPVQLISEKPTVVGVHVMRFETTGGAFAEINVRVTDATMSYHVDANDVEISISELQKAVKEDNLEDVIKEKSQAKAWVESSITGREDLPVYVDTKNLENAKAGETVAAEAYALEKPQITYHRLKDSVNLDVVAVSKVFNVKVVQDKPVSPTKPGNGGTTSTADITNPSIYVSTMLLAVIGLCIFKKKKEQHQ